MYEAQITTIANWINRKVDLLGNRITEQWEQMLFTWLLTVLVAVVPETVKGIPFKALLLDYAVDWINNEGDEQSVEARLLALAEFVQQQKTEA